MWLGVPSVLAFTKNIKHLRTYDWEGVCLDLSIPFSCLPFLIRLKPDMADTDAVSSLALRPSFLLSTKEIISLCFLTRYLLYWESNDVSHRLKYPLLLRLRWPYQYSWFHKPYNTSICQGPEVTSFRFPTNSCRKREQSRRSLVADSDRKQSKLFE